jgi:hypothetical protein
MAEQYTQHLLALGEQLPTKSEQLKIPSGSTDMGNVSYVVPSIHPKFRIPTTAVNHTAGSL